MIGIGGATTQGSPDGNDYIRYRHTLEFHQIDSGEEERNVNILSVIKTRKIDINTRDLCFFHSRHIRHRTIASLNAILKLDGKWIDSTSKYSK